MKIIIKKILLTMATIFLVWQSYNLLSMVDNITPNSWGSIIFVAWIINLYITGIFAFSGFAFPTQKLLSKSYYKITRPQFLTRIYNAFQVNVFRKMLLATL